MTAITAITTPLAASSSARLPDATTRRRPRWSVVVSVLLHLALLTLAIIGAQHKRSITQSAPPASVAMVFESGGKTPSSIANPAPLSPNRQASPAPQPSQPPPPHPAPPVEQPPPAAPPVEQPPPTTPPVEQPTPAAPPVEQPPPTPPAEVPTPQEVVPPAQEVAPPPPAPQPKPQPLPEAPSPPTTAPATQAPAPEALPLPPPVPVPAPRATPQPETPRLPQPRQPARPVSPPRAAPAFPAPMDFSLGPRAAPLDTEPPRTRASPGTIDMSFAPMMGGGDITQVHPQGKGDDVGDDWFNLVAAWWLRHRFYPTEAGRLQQQGDVQVRLVVARDGRVKAVDIQEKSGSPWLDLGALAVFRDAKLPPLPPDVREPDVTVDFTIHYMIIR
jgi:periplasmic protein TonB